MQVCILSTTRVCRVDTCSRFVAHSENHDMVSVLLAKGTDMTNYLSSAYLAVWTVCSVEVSNVWQRAFIMARKPADQALHIQTKRSAALCEKVPLCNTYIWSTWKYTSRGKTSCRSSNV